MRDISDLDTNAIESSPPGASNFHAIERSEQAVDFLFLDDQLGTKINDLRSLRLVRAFVHASSFYRMTLPVPEIQGKRCVNEVN